MGNAPYPGKPPKVYMRVMKEEVLPNGRLRSECPAANCHTTRSVRTGNRFLHYIDHTARAQSKLLIHDILLLVHLWLYARMPISTVVSITVHSSATVVDWNKFAGTTCGMVLNLQPKMIGTEVAPMKIDESCLCGRRKYGKGRLLAGDIDHGAANEENYDQVDALLGTNEVEPENIDEDLEDTSSDYV